MLLADKVALVTGASRGIGRAVAETFVAHGARVVVTARSASIHEVASALNARAEVALAVQGDLTDDATIRECVKRCRSAHGRMDVLVNNAGVMTQSVMGMIAPAEIRATLEINVVSLMNLTQYSARLMKKSGSIINMSSIAWRGLAGSTAYSAAKGAVASFTQAAAKELAPRNVRVNAIAPGFIDTDMTRDLAPENRTQAMDAIGLGRLGQAQDVANVALFLASDLSSYVTGQVIGVDGAMQV